MEELLDEICQINEYIDYKVKGVIEIEDIVSDILAKRISYLNTLTWNKFVKTVSGIRVDDKVKYYVKNKKEKTDFDKKIELINSIVIQMGWKKVCFNI